MALSRTAIVNFWLVSIISSKDKTKINKIPEICTQYTLNIKYSSFLLVHTFIYSVLYKYLQNKTETLASPL